MEPGMVLGKRRILKDLSVPHTKVRRVKLNFGLYGSVGFVANIKFSCILSLSKLGMIKHYQAICFPNTPYYSFYIFLAICDFFFWKNEVFMLCKLLGLWFYFIRVQKKILPK